MEQLPDFGDTRQTAGCAYCGYTTGSRDHVPSRVLLDEPYPENLPVVAACDACNQGVSKDEAYLACLVECARVGATEPRLLERPKIRRLMTDKPALASRLEAACQRSPKGVAFLAEARRVGTVLVKLARGHALYELHEPQYEEPSHLAFAPIGTLTNDQRDVFETPPPVALFPEVGSRAMQRMFVIGSPGMWSVSQDWVMVQPDRYRYLAAGGNGVVVRVVLSEYLACEVGWLGFPFDEGPSSSALSVPD